jgi:hypothetical protein
VFRFSEPVRRYQFLARFRPIILLGCDSSKGGQLGFLLTRQSINRFPFFWSQFELCRSNIFFQMRD